MREPVKPSIQSMSRRHFISAAAAGTAGAALATTSTAKAERPNALEKHTFKLKYAPHFGLFTNHAGKDPLAQLDFMAEVGFTALEDNGMPRRERELQNAIAKRLQKLGMEMGVFVAYADFGKTSFVDKDEATREMLMQKMRDAVELAKRVTAKWVTVVPGRYALNTEWDYQTANCIENLKWCSGVLEPSGLIMVLEPLNAWANHPGLFLTKIPQAYQICRAVNSPSCKILNDLYHQQITEGNLIPNIDMAWDETAYFQVGDNPGRKEPTTGEINYRNVFKHIHAKGFTGIVGMEHGKSKKGKAGEIALIEAYASSDDF